ncbi:RluA family pseudouridine synthase [Patescibacteria group bacterium]|nr:RluA family pseudouridine synthase [Patescibacteria group bacterium]
MKIPIIYEDNDILAVNKPAFLVVHNGDESVAGWLIKNYSQIKDIGEDSNRPGIVHRLDKDTSGILLIAKNQKSFEYLKEQFQQRKIKKTYLVLVHGRLKNDEGVIELAIAKSKKDFRKKTCLAESRRATQKSIGKIREAVTEYKALKRFNNFTLIEAYPKTGRTHQIRVHLKAIGHPVVCDKLYGFKKQKCPLGLNRHFLHASSLDFNLPASPSQGGPSGGRIKLEADLPQDLQNTLNMLDYSS